MLVHVNVLSWQKMCHWHQMLLCHKTPTMRYVESHRAQFIVIHCQQHTMSKYYGHASIAGECYVKLVSNILLYKNQSILVKRARVCLCVCLGKNFHMFSNFEIKICWQKNFFKSFFNLKKICHICNMIKYKSISSSKFSTCHF